MGFGETLYSMFGVMFIFGAPVVLIRTILAYKLKMRELEVRGIQGSDSSLRAEIEAMRQEMRSLRDTTTQYDLSFDTALQNMEKKVEILNRKLLLIESK